MTKVCTIGLGYIGLPTSVILASEGYEVIGVDIREDVVNNLNKGVLEIEEPGLQERFDKAFEQNLIHAQTQPCEADIYLVVVPTPFRGDTHQPNLDYVEAATRSIAPFVQNGNLVILESTSPVGTTEKLRDILDEEGVDTENIFFAHCPERVIPGNLVYEFFNNDRIVGGLTPKATEKAVNFYRAFVRGEVLETDAKSAELAKLAENTYRDVNIALANELSIICDEAKMDIWEVIRLANRHPRVNLHQPGCGVGGHCIAVDPWFIVASNQKEATLIKRSRERNMEKTQWCIEQIKSLAPTKKEKIAIFGLSYKPDIDDLRESPALEIAQTLSQQQYDVVAVEPHIVNLENLQLVSKNEALKSADVHVQLVSHSDFKDITWSHTGKPYLNFCSAE